MVDSNRKNLPSRQQRVLVAKAPPRRRCRAVVPLAGLLAVELVIPATIAIVPAFRKQMSMASEIRQTTVQDPRRERRPQRRAGPLSVRRWRRRPASPRLALPAPPQQFWAVRCRGPWLMDPEGRCRTPNLCVGFLCRRRRSRRSRAALHTKPRGGQRRQTI
jgi:hypothetical protein